MCDEAGKQVNQTSKAEVRKAAATTTPQVAPQVTTQGAAQVAVREDAATATPQVAAAATAATHKAATHKDAAHKDADSKKAQVVDPEFARAENEDDDGYDPYSDRRPVSEPLFERDPWS